MDHPFRSAVVGGFNRQDVLNFLEEQARQASQSQQKLQGELDALRQERGDLSGQLDQVRQELEVSGQEAAELKDRLERSGRELADSQKRSETLARELEEARKERDALRREVEALRPDAQAYAELKECTAGVELEAHRRAKAIQEKAEGDVQKVRRQTEQWLQKVGREYDALRGQVESTVAQAAGELEKVGAGLEQINALMDSQGEALEDVRRAYDATDLNRIEAPMPLDED